jgi:hypothetical protein
MTFKGHEKGSSVAYNRYSAAHYTPYYKEKEFRTMGVVMFHSALSSWGHCRELLCIALHPFLHKHGSFEERIHLCYIFHWVVTAMDPSLGNAFSFPLSLRGRESLRSSSWSLEDEASFESVT